MFSTKAKKNIIHGSCRITVAALGLLVMFAIFFVSSVSVYAADGEISVPVKSNEKIRIEITSEDDAPLPDPSVIDIDKEGEITIPYNNIEGEYHYTVKQVAKDDDAVYDTTEWKVTIYVHTENGEWKTVVISYKDGSSYKPAEIRFDNSHPSPSGFDSLESVLVDPPISKEVRGEPETDGRFTFALKPVSNDAGIPVSRMPLPTGSINGEKRITVMGSGSYEFGVMKMTKPGTYNYEITEVDVGEDGYTYDKTRYRVVFVVTERNGKLSAVRHIYRQGTGEVDSATFVNIYETPTTPTTKKDDPSSRTGDQTAVMGLLLLMVVSVLGIAWVRIRRNSNRRK